jgi:Spy/CpxP family protein refolding chaperone
MFKFLVALTIIACALAFAPAARMARTSSLQMADNSKWLMYLKGHRRC